MDSASSTVIDRHSTAGRELGRRGYHPGCFRPSVSDNTSRALAPGAAATDPQVRRLFRYLALLGTVCLLVAMALLLITTAAGLIDVAVDYHCSWCGRVQWLAGVLGLAGVTLGLVDLLVLLPVRRAHERRIDAEAPAPGAIAVALTCYNDEASIAASVRDFAAHPAVSRVIVVDNNSRDGSAAAAAAAGARVVVERQPATGSCVHRCLQRAAPKRTPTSSPSARAT